MKNDFKQFIENEFMKRKKLNPQYSMRAFSRDIGLSPASLSQVLNDKRVLHKNSIMKVLSYFEDVSDETKK